LSESLPSSDPAVQKRRSTRIAQSVPITVIGVDALGQAFKERTSTVSINCHGCKYQSKHYVPKTAQVTIEIPRGQADAPPRVVEGRVAWVQRPRTVRELFQIGVEFAVPGNVWGIAFPPADWFPAPGEPADQVEIPRPGTPELTAKKEELAAPAPSRSSAGNDAEPEAPVEAAVTPEENKVHVLPAPATAHETMSTARQMARLLAEAKQHLRRTMQTSAADAVAQEVRTAREQMEQQLQTAVKEAVQKSAAKAAEESVQTAVKAAVENSLQKLVEQASRQAVQNALAAFEQAQAASAPKTEELDAQVRTAVERVVQASAAKLAQQTIEQSVQQSIENAVKQSVSAAVKEASAILPAQISTAGNAPGAKTLQQLDEAAESRLENWRNELERAATELRSRSLAQLNQESQSAAQQWRAEFDAALAGASQQMSQKLTELSEEATARAEQEISARSASLQALLNEAASEAQRNLDSLCASLEEKQTHAEAAASRVGEAAQHAEQISTQLEAMSRAAYEDARRKFEELKEVQADELDRRTAEIIQKKAGELDRPIQEIADRSFERLSKQLEEQLAPHYRRAQEMEEQLKASNREAENVLEQFRSQMHEVSGQALSAALEKMRQQVADLPVDFEQKCRAALGKLEEELEAKSTEASHTTFEALYKASEWYQKKAQAGMQAALEKMLEQSTGDMRNRAAELSRMFASELDHCSRSYVEHAQGMIEESAKEAKERTRENLAEMVQTTSAMAMDELNRLAREGLRRFEEAAIASSDDAHTRMRQKSEQAVAEFEGRIEERMVQSAAEARKNLEAQLKPLVQEFYAAREDEQNAWLERMKGTVEQSIEQYKERLENASNSWLLASAATLGQHSRGVLETLSHAAEERLRDTCADVFANLGETLRARLLGLSTDVGTKKTDEKK